MRGKRMSNKVADAKKFARTAARVKKINKPMNLRGGKRL